MPTDYGPSGSNAAPSTSALRTGSDVACDGGFACPAPTHIEGCYTGDGHPDSNGSAANRLRASVDTLEAIVSAFCRAVGEPIPQDAICAADRLRAEREHLGAMRDHWKRCNGINVAENDRLRAVLREWLAADEDAERDYTETSEARLAAAIQAAYGALGLDPSASGPGTSTEPAGEAPLTQAFREAE